MPCGEISSSTPPQPCNPSEHRGADAGDPHTHKPRHSTTARQPKRDRRAPATPQHEPRTAGPRQPRPPSTPRDGRAEGTPAGGRRIPLSRTLGPRCQPCMGAGGQGWFHKVGRFVLSTPGDNEPDLLPLSRKSFPLEPPSLRLAPCVCAHSCAHHTLFLPSVGPILGPHL